MRRVWALLSMLVIAQGCLPCHWKDATNVWQRHEELGARLITLDQMLIDQCRSSNVSGVKYHYNDKGFKISIPIPGFEPNDFTLKSRLDLLFIEACKCNNLKFSDIRLISPHLSILQGRWSYDEDELTITIPRSLVAPLPKGFRPREWNYLPQEGTDWDGPYGMDDIRGLRSSHET